MTPDETNDATPQTPVKRTGFTPEATADASMHFGGIPSVITIMIAKDESGETRVIDCQENAAAIKELFAFLPEDSV